MKNRQPTMSISKNVFSVSTELFDKSTTKFSIRQALSKKISDFISKVKYKYTVFPEKLYKGTKKFISVKYPSDFF